LMVAVGANGLNFTSVIVFLILKVKPYFLISDF
jgi:hypothetical protein